MESEAYRKLLPIECLRYAHDKSNHGVKSVKITKKVSTLHGLKIRWHTKKIQIMKWVSSCVLAQDEAQKRANVVEHFIRVASVSTLVTSRGAHTDA